MAASASSAVCQPAPVRSGRPDTRSRRTRIASNVCVVERERDKRGRGIALGRIEAAGAGKMGFECLPVAPTFGNGKRRACFRRAHRGTPFSRTRSFSDAGASDISMTCTSRPQARPTSEATTNGSAQFSTSRSISHRPVPQRGGRKPNALRQSAGTVSLARGPHTNSPTNTPHANREPRATPRGQPADSRQAVARSRTRIATGRCRPRRRT